MSTQPVAQSLAVDSNHLQPVVDTLSVVHQSLVEVDRSSFGPVAAWGWNFYGQSNSPLTGPNDVIQVAAGRDHSVALRTDGTVEAWGSNSSGQSAVPADLPSVTAIAAGFYFTLAVLEDGSLTGWGANGQGQLNIPEDLGPVVQVDGGYDFAVALEAGGTVRAWGGNAWGQLNIPEGLSDVLQVAASEQHALALRQDGSIVMWGAQTTVPADLGEIKLIAGGYHRTAALTDEGIMMWSSSGMAFNVTPGVVDIDNIAVGAGHWLARHVDGTVIGSGGGSWGQGNVPASLPPATSVATGAFHSLAALAEGDAIAGALMDPMLASAKPVLANDDLYIEAIYPSPAQNRVSIQVRIPSDEVVTLEVFDMLGRRVAQVVRGHELPAGGHTLTWNANVPAGNYVLVLHAGSSRATRAVTVTR